MAQKTRRKFLAGLATASLLPRIPGQQTAGDDQRESQRRDLARVFGTNSATLQELSLFRVLQENRVASPLSLRALSDFIDSSVAVRLARTSHTPELAMLLLWNGFALDATSVDHTAGSEAVPLATYGAQFGPGRSSRALAIVHLAIFEAVNVISRRFNGYQGIQAQIMANLGLQVDRVSRVRASVSRAITEAAFETLIALYPAQRSIFELERAKLLPLRTAPDAAEALGEKIGKEAARLVLRDRQQDQSTVTDPAAVDFAGLNPLEWHQDPVSLAKPALGAKWGEVLPFVVSPAAKYRPAPPPAAGSADFIAAFKEVKSLGGDPCAPAEGARWPTPTLRTGSDCSQATRIGDNLDDNNETFKGLFWAYDGVPMLCAPPRLYNMLATSIALKEKPIHRVEDMARLLALINIGMADAGVCAWEAKYHYAFARPVTAIRAFGADDSTAGARDPKWTPLGAPVTNGTVGSRNLTPPFPSYPSGHATFGGALFEMLRLFWGTGQEGVPFRFVSDEFNGVNRGPGDTAPRPRVNRYFPSFSAAEWENAQSRVWLGIHWSFDADSGIELGRLVAREVFANILTTLQ